MLVHRRTQKYPAFSFQMSWSYLEIFRSKACSRNLEILGYKKKTLQNKGCLVEFKPLTFRSCLDKKCAFKGFGRKAT